MEHVAIMRNSWGLLDKIINGKKTIESRWYKTKYRPWGRINPGDTLYFKDSGKPVTIKSKVDEVKFISNLRPEKVLEILNEYGQKDGLGIDDVPKYFQMFKDKRYCILVFFSDVESIHPFSIDKSGYGMMSSWITINDVGSIRTDNLIKNNYQQRIIQY